MHVADSIKPLSKIIPSLYTLHPNLTSGQQNLSSTRPDEHARNSLVSFQPSLARAWTSDPTITTET